MSTLTFRGDVAAPRRDPSGLFTFFVEETHLMVEDDERVRLGETGPNEVQAPSVGALFRGLQGRLGACVGKVYQDARGGPPMHVGWVFRRRTGPDEYLEGDPHLCETWATVEARPRRTVRSYARLGSSRGS